MDPVEHDSTFAPLLAAAVIFRNRSIYVRQVEQGSRVRWVLPGELAKPEHRPSVVLNEHLYKTIGWTFLNDWIHFTGGIIVHNDPQHPNHFQRDFIINYYWLDLSDIKDFEAPADWLMVPYEEVVRPSCTAVYANDRVAIIESQKLRELYYEREHGDKFIT